MAPQWAAVPSVEYERDIQQVTSVLTMVEYKKKQRNGVNWSSNPHSSLLRILWIWWREWMHIQVYLYDLYNGNYKHAIQRYHQWAFAADQSAQKVI